MNNIHKTARRMVAPGKGLLAADESTGTANKRLKAIGIDGTPETRRQYRDLFLSTPGIEKFLSGVILHEETLRQSNAMDKMFLDLLKEKNILPGVKVDKGKVEDPGSPKELITQGLEGLPERLREYAGMGAVFAKWRAVVRIGDALPTEANIRKDAESLAEYALACQKTGLVPIVEPEVLLDGDHSINRAEEVTTETLQIVFEKLAEHNVDLAGTILKTSMVLPGSSHGKKADPKTVANYTVRTLKNSTPHDLAGVVFLSGGQEPVEATKNLSAINKLKPFPWPTTFSFARALQEPSLKIWRGEPANIKKTRQAFLHRLKMNAAAVKGEYSEDME